MVVNLVFPAPSSTVSRNPTALPLPMQPVGNVYQGEYSWQLEHQQLMHLGGHREVLFKEII